MLDKLDINDRDIDYLRFIRDIHNVSFWKNKGFGRLQVPYTIKQNLKGI